MYKPEWCRRPDYSRVPVIGTDTGTQTTGLRVRVSSLRFSRRSQTPFELPRRWRSSFELPGSSEDRIAISGFGDNVQDQREIQFPRFPLGRLAARSLREIHGPGKTIRAARRS